MTATLRDRGIVACHCGQCRTWSGGAPGLAVAVTEIAFDGTPATYRSSDWADRGFCPTCGTSLFWQELDKPVTYVHVGVLDDTSGLTIEDEIFTASRAPWQPAVPGARQSLRVEHLGGAPDALADQA